MKTEAKIFLFLVIFFLVVAPVYPYMTWAIDGQVEVIGTTVLILTFLFSAMIWTMLLLTGRSTGPRPEDRAEGEIVEGAGVQGFFPPTSIVPFWSAAVITVILLGPVFGWWLTILGIGLGIWVVCGWAYEFYVGDYKH